MESMIESTAYVRLSEAAYLEPGLQEGKTQIWFTKAKNFFCFNQGEMPIKETLCETHGFLGEILETDLDEIYRIMQEDVWSPNGDGQALLDWEEVAHASMCIGDVIVIGSRAWVCSDCSEGWKEIE